MVRKRFFFLPSPSVFVKCAYTIPKCTGTYVLYNNNTQDTIKSLFDISVSDERDPVKIFVKYK